MYLVSFIISLCVCIKISRNCTENNVIFFISLNQLYGTDFKSVTYKICLNKTEIAFFYWLHYQRSAHILP